jgi:hypothetical protein
MNYKNNVIIYSKSIGSSYNYFFISLCFIILYVSMYKYFSKFTLLIIKSLTILLLLYSSYLISYNNYINIVQLKNDIFRSKYKNLRHSIIYNSVFVFFILILLYNFIYF